jgi:hypothetical protein
VLKTSSVKKSDCLFMFSEILFPFEIEDKVIVFLSAALAKTEIKWLTSLSEVVSLIETVTV